MTELENRSRRTELPKPGLQPFVERLLPFIRKVHVVILEGIANRLDDFHKLFLLPVHELANLTTPSHVGSLGLELAHVLQVAFDDQAGHGLVLLLQLFLEPIDEGA